MYQPLTITDLKGQIRQVQALAAKRQAIGFYDAYPVQDKSRAGARGTGFVMVILGFCLVALAGFELPITNCSITN
jgi:hypothetical protein